MTRKIGAVQGKVKTEHRVTKRITSTGEVRYDARVRIAGRQVSKTFNARKLADAWLTQAMADELAGVAIDPREGKVTLSGYRERWTERGGTRGSLAPRTSEYYAHLFTKHIEPTLGGLALSSIRAENVASWFAAKKRENPLTAAKAYRFLSTLMNSAVSDGLIGANPCRVKGAGVESSPERPLVDIDAARALADNIAPEYRLLVLLAMFGQLRLGELLGLKVSDVDLNGHTVNIERQAVEVKGQRLVTPPKTASGVRLVAVPPVLSIELAGHIDHYCSKPFEGERWLFATQLTGRPPYRFEVYKAWLAARTATNEALDAERLPRLPENLHLHDLRHAGLTLVAQGGATTKELMRRGGHASPQAALRYQHAADTRDREIANSLGAMLSSPSRTAIVLPFRSTEGSVRDGAPAELPKLGNKGAANWL